MYLLLTDEQQMIVDSCKKVFQKINNEPFAIQWQAVQKHQFHNAVAAGQSLFEQALILQQAGMFNISPLIRSTIQVNFILHALQQPASNEAVALAFRTDALQLNGQTLTGILRFVELEPIVQTVYVCVKQNDHYVIGLLSLQQTTCIPYETFQIKQLYQIDCHATPFTTIATIDHKQFDRFHQAITLLQTAQMVGGIEEVIRQTVHYVNERQQFEQPIAAFQAVQHHLANMYTRFKGVKLLTYKALCTFEQVDSVATMHLAKAAANDAYKDITLMAHQLFGGNGYTMESPLIYYSEQAKWLSVLNGSTFTHQHAYLIWRKLAYHQLVG